LFTSYGSRGTLSDCRMWKMLSGAAALAESWIPKFVSSASDLRVRGRRGEWKGWVYLSLDLAVSLVGEILQPRRAYGSCCCYRKISLMGKRVRRLFVRAHLEKRRGFRALKNPDLDWMDRCWPHLFVQDRFGITYKQTAEDMAELGKTPGIRNAVFPAFGNKGHV